MTEIFIYSLIAIAGLTVPALIIYFAAGKNPLTVVEYFILDKKYPIIHFVGYESVMPDDGDSFEVYKHYVFNFETRKLTLCAKQRGTGISLTSDFIKRSIQKFFADHKMELAFGKQAVQNKFIYMYPPEEPVFELHHFTYQDSDTTDAPKLGHNCLIFTRHEMHGECRFTFRLVYHKKEIVQHEMNGIADYYFFGLCDNKNAHLYFTYRKKYGLKSGMALCIVNYQTGQLVLDEFIR